MGRNCVSDAGKLATRWLKITYPIKAGLGIGDEPLRALEFLRVASGMVFRCSM